MTTDQAFFAAYGQFVGPENGLAKSAKTRELAGQTDPRRTGPAIEKQYVDGSWYRIDQRHVEHGGAPTPHLGKGRTENVSVDPTPVEATSWNPWTEWPGSCLVMASPMPATASTDIQPRSEPATPARQPEPATEEPSRVVASASKLISDSIEQSVESSSVETDNSEPAPVWAAHWEVDEFAWPDDLVRLHEDQGDYFRYAGEKLLAASREGLKALAVVTTREKEGCTTMAICLARAAAAAGARVVLVDANLVHPELGAKLGLEFSHGWQEAITGTGTLAEAAVMALDSNLTLLPLSATHRLSSLCDAKVSQILREISASFDLVIVDSGIAPAGDAEMFESGSDCPINAALIVRDLRRTSETETLVTASRLKSLGIDAIGIAENFLRHPSNQIAAA